MCPSNLASLSQFLLESLTAVHGMYLFGLRARARRARAVVSGAGGTRARRAGGPAEPGEQVVGSGSSGEGRVEVEAGLDGASGAVRGRAAVRGSGAPGRAAGRARGRGPAEAGGEAR